MGRDKTTQKGIGPVVEEPAGPPSSGARESDPERADSQVSKSTQRGLASRPAKMVTKVGVAPPSSPPPPVESSSRPGGVEPLEAELQAAEPSSADSNQDSEVNDRAFEGARDEPTPTDSQRESDPGDRSQFRTAPGGGKNRISGGRAAASAYVSPKTLPPGHGKGHVTAAVKVLETVKEEARSFQTEPSLLRRRASSLPPPFSQQQKQRRRRGLLWWAVALTIVVGGLSFWALSFSGDAGTEAPLPQGKLSSPEVTRAPVSGKRRSNQEDVTPPATEEEENQPASPPSALPTGAPLPAAADKSRPAKSAGPFTEKKTTLPGAGASPLPVNKATPKKPPEKTDELWLE